MSNLPRRLNVDGTDLIGREIGIDRRAVSPRIEQAVTRAVDVEHGRGIVRAARVRAQEYVTAEALAATAGLTELETVYSQRSPGREDRFSAIVDTSTAVMVNIVAEGAA